MTDTASNPQCPALEEAASECLESLASVDTFDVNLRDHAEAWAAIEAFAAKVRAAERNRWEQERTTYRSLLAQARLVLRGPHTEKNIVVRELVERIESRGVQFGA